MFERSSKVNSLWCQPTLSGRFHSPSPKWQSDLSGSSPVCVESAPLWCRPWPHDNTKHCLENDILVSLDFGGSYVECPVETEAKNSTNTKDAEPKIKPLCEAESVSSGNKVRTNTHRKTRTYNQRKI